MVASIRIQYPIAILSYSCISHSSPLGSYCFGFSFSFPASINFLKKSSRLVFAFLYSSISLETDSNLSAEMLISTSSSLSLFRLLLMPCVKTNPSSPTRNPKVRYTSISNTKHATTSALTPLTLTLLVPDVMAVMPVIRAAFHTTSRKLNSRIRDSNLGVDILSLIPLPARRRTRS